MVFALKVRLLWLIYTCLLQLQLLLILPAYKLGLFSFLAVTYNGL